MKNTLCYDFSLSIAQGNCDSSGCPGAHVTKVVVTAAKGQMISKCLFGAIVLTRKPTIWKKNTSALASIQRSSQKNKGIFSC